jgi:hypothetical protein
MINFTDQMSNHSVFVTNSIDIDSNTHNAIYISPNVPINYGYYLPISNRLTGNTYTFIYQTKGCEMFVAPISTCNQYSKEFVSYEKYSENLRTYYKQRKTESNISRQTDLTTLKKTTSYRDLGAVNKLYEIFNMEYPDDEKYPIPPDNFTPVESISESFFGKNTNSSISIDDFIFDE